MGRLARSETESLARSGRGIRRASSLAAYVRGGLFGLAWVGGAALGYYLLCALGFGLYRLLAWAF